MKKKMGRSVAHYIDQDYEDKLSPSEAAWLEKFNLEYYGGFVTAEPKEGDLHQKIDQKREIWRAQKRRRNDVQNISNPAMESDMAPELNPEEILLLTTMDEKDAISINKKRRNLFKIQNKSKKMNE